MFTLWLYKRTFITTGLLCVFFWADAQVVWNNTYLHNRPSMIFGSVIPADNNYIVTGTTQGTTFNLSKALLAKVDESGVMIDAHIFIDSTTDSDNLFSNALIENNKGEFVFAGVSKDTASRLLFCIANRAADSISVFRYYTPNAYSFTAGDLVQYANAYYVAGQFIDKTAADGDMVLVKIDASGNRLWQKYYGQYRRDFASSITLLNNGNLLLGGVRNYLHNVYDRENTWLMEVDTNGNTVRQWFDPNDSTYEAKGLIETDDGSFIYGAQKKYEQTVNDIRMTATLLKLGSNFTKRWVFSGGIRGTFTGFTDIAHVSDSTYIACGNYSNRHGWIIKFSENGTIFWEKKYEGLQDTAANWNVLRDIDVLPDGSFIAAGFCQRVTNPTGLPPQEGWLLKIDKDGCVLQSCVNDIETLQPSLNALLKVYPNPVGSHVIIDFSNLPIYSKLSITNIYGDLMAFENLNQATGALELNTSQYSNGIYIAQIQTDGRILAFSKFVVAN